MLGWILLDATIVKQIESTEPCNVTSIIGDKMLWIAMIVYVCIFVQWHHDDKPQHGTIQKG